MNQVPRQNSKQANVIADGNLLEIGGGEMDEREAIILLTGVLYSPLNHKAREAINLAIAALEKQVGNKPINDYVEDETHSGNRFKRQIKVCECGNIYLQKYQKYCNECGQRIDWGNEVE